MIGGLNAIWLLPQGRDLLLAGARPGSHACHGFGLG